MNPETPSPEEPIQTPPSEQSPDLDRKNQDTNIPQTPVPETGSAFSSENIQAEALKAAKEAMDNVTLTDLADAEKALAQEAKRIRPEGELNTDFERQAKEAEEIRVAREQIEKAHSSDQKEPEVISSTKEEATNEEWQPQVPPKVEQQFSEERVGVATEQPAPREKNPNEPKVEDSRFNPNYESSDLYERLGVPRNASPEDISAAYREAAKKTHPDKGGDKDHFKSVQDAFDTLSNPSKRVNYDFSNPKEGPKTEQSNPEQPMPDQPESKQPHTQDKTNPETPKTDNPNQEAQFTGKKFSERFKEGVKRGAKKASETWKTEETIRKAKAAEAKAQKKAEKKAKEEAEKEKIRQEAEIVKAARAEEKKKKAEEAQKEKEKRKAAREAERAAQEESKEKPIRKEEAEKQSEETEANIERSPNPWRDWGKQPRVSEKYFEATRLEPQSKKYINESLQNEIKDIKDGLASKWFEENKYKLEARGIPINGLNQEAIVRLAIDPATGELSKEVLDDLEKNKDLYEADLLKMDNAKALGMEFEKDKVSPESQFLMLNHLEKRTSSLYDQINKLESLGGAENRDKAVSLQKEIDNLFIARKELAEKATGRDLTKETLARVAEKLGYISKEEYMKDRALVSHTELTVKVGKMNSLAENEFAALSPKEKKGYKDMGDFVKKWQAKGEKLGLSQDQLYALSAAGYKTSATRKTGFLFFGRGIELTKTDGTIVKVDKKEFYKNIVKPAEDGYNAGIAVDGQKELGRRWDQEETGALISELTVTMEESVGGTEAAYKRLKQNLVEEYERNPVREKTEKEQVKQDKEFEKEGKEGADILSFLDDALKGEGKFANLTGDVEKDKKILKSISDDYGMGISSSTFRGLDAGSYSKAAKKKGGLISLFIELMIKNPYKKIMSTAA